MLGGGPRPRAPGPGPSQYSSTGGGGGGGGGGPIILGGPVMPKVSGAVLIFTLWVKREKNIGAIPLVERLDKITREPLVGMDDQQNI